MANDDQETLAAEYVLGTLSADERHQAEALLGVDPGFAEVVRHWERRLGELHVMVEAVEPPPEVWDRIKTQIATRTPSGGAHLPRVKEAPPSAAPPPQPADPEDLMSPAAKLASVLPPREDEETSPTSVPPSAVADLAGEIGAPEPAPKSVERSADVIYLAGRLARWRQVTYALSALAAVLALYVALAQFAPNLIPAPLQPRSSGTVARVESGARLQQDRLVAVLQHDPTAPAFLLTLDTQNHMLTVRRVSATPESGHSYELWLVSNRFLAPRSLGLVGKDEFTQRAVPGNYDVDTLRTATYAISLEAADGSQSGAPTGPILFTGRAVEALPGSQPRT
jgi:anti-sigma-K factor RskA